MKRENNKHDHKLTKFLKGIIFSLVMLAPFIAIGVKCWYVASNKNAYQSYRGSYNFESYAPFSEIQTLEENTDYTNTTNYFYFDTPKIVNTYYLNLTNKDQINFTTMVFPIEYTNLFNLNNYNYTNLYILIGCISNSNTNLVVCRIYDNLDLSQTLPFGGGYNNPHLDNITPLDSLSLSIDNFTNNKYNFITNSTIAQGCRNTNTTVYTPLHWFNYFNILTYISDTTLSSVFYSAVQELDKASIFSWTTNTAIYSAIVNTTEGLGIISPPLAVLITYWSIITAIYIIFDIVIEMFIFLTHWANDHL